MNGRELRCTNGPTGANPVRKSDALRHAYAGVPIMAPDTLFCPQRPSLGRTLRTVLNVYS
jgi:hypothetical protein